MRRAGSKQALRWAWAVAALLLASVPSLRAEDVERRFFLVLDAVPYSSVAALEARGAAPDLFGQLGSPLPLISTFPSTTTVALAAAFAPLGLERSPGYEARFFDWTEERVRGGGLVSYFRIDFPWRSFFQWSKKNVARSALASLRPVGASESRVRSALEDFLAAEQHEFFAYVETTDTAAHLKGPDSLDRIFVELGAAIAEARSRGERFKVIVLSDHGIDGGDPLTNVLPGIVRGLESAGLQRTRRLRGSEDVVITPYGLVSSFEAYAHPATVPRLGELLASVEGVGLCVFRSESGLRVVSDRASARVLHEGESWAYLPDRGDPLGYSKVIERLGPGSKPGAAEAWHSDRVWFEATKNERYPDALSRIAGGFELVENPASVICSVAPGYMFGNRKTERAARLTGGRLRWTHGALDWEASTGFLLTDVEASLPHDGVRLSEALLPLLRDTDQSAAGGAESSGAGPDSVVGVATSPGGRNR